MQRYPFHSPLRFHLGDQAEAAEVVRRAPVIRIDSASAANQALTVEGTLTSGEAQQLMRSLPVEERSAAWDRLWDAHAEVWRALPEDELREWLQNILLHGSTYPLLYPAPPEVPALECINLLQRFRGTPRFTTVDNAVRACLARFAASPEPTELLAGLLPVIGALELKSCTPNLLACLDESEELLRAQPTESGDDLLYTMLRCLSSFRSAELGFVFRRFVEDDAYLDVCFTALARIDEPIEQRWIDRVIDVYGPAEPEYTDVLCQRYLDSLGNGGADGIVRLVQAIYARTDFPSLSERLLTLVEKKTDVEVDDRDPEQVWVVKPDSGWRPAELDVSFMGDVLGAIGNLGRMTMEQTLAAAEV